MTIAANVPVLEPYRADEVSIYIHVHLSEGVVTKRVMIPRQDPVDVRRVTFVQPVHAPPEHKPPPLHSSEPDAPQLVSILHVQVCEAFGIADIQESLSSPSLILMMPLATNFP